MSLIPSDPGRGDSFILVAKLFGASSALALVIKFGIKAVIPTFTISAFADDALNHTALVAIGLPSLLIALILLLDRSRK